MKIDTNKLELAMARHCLSLGALAIKAECNVKTASKVLNGYETKPEAVGKIARALELDPAELIPGPANAEV